ncbi:DUF3243 domain-containing protein [Virgibacillus xinjiangensis]|uniref:DUF3243 domain-containing protein n=1 Tax=Virgibacillus xinjiangensis TaxID=393090 RepID=A0ABV7CYJ5_9BACI
MGDNRTNVYIDREVTSIDEDKKDDILQNFDRFTNYLEDKMELGKKMGLNEDKLTKGAEKIADYLAKHEEPRTREEKLLQALWKVGDTDLQKGLARMLVRLVDEK